MRAFTATVLTILCICTIPGMECCPTQIGNTLHAWKNAVFRFVVEPNGPVAYLKPCNVNMTSNDPNLFCNLTQRTYCLEDICKCKKPHVMQWDPERQMCIGQVGHYCAFTNDFCIPGASCLKINARCHCNPDHYRTPNQSCYPRPKLGEKCTSTAQCHNEYEWDQRCSKTKGVCVLYYDEVE